MSFTMIAAVGENLELGKNNDLIWHFKEDMKFFKKQTLHKACLMGLRTFYSLPNALSERENWVLSDVDIHLPEGVKVFRSLDEIFEKYEQSEKEVMVIGGASIYAQFLPHSKKLILTEIHASSDADVYFPSFNKDEWNRNVLYSVEENNVKFDHVEYIRK